MVTSFSYAEDKNRQLT
ncbi:hypothetical protein, partial [Escherichia coli]